MQKRTQVYTEFKAAGCTTDVRPPETVSRPGAQPSRKSFKPRYPAWLVLPSLDVPDRVLPRRDGHPRRVLVRHPDRVQPDHLRVQPRPIQAGARPHLPRHLRAHLGAWRRWERCSPWWWAIRWPTGWRVTSRTTSCWLLLLIIVPFWTSFLIRTYALKIILDSNGYLAQMLHLDVMYSATAVAIGLVYNYLPLFILPVFASLERMDWTTHRSGQRPDGASRSRRSGRSRCRSASRGS